MPNGNNLNTSSMTAKYGDLSIQEYAQILIKKIDRLISTLLNQIIHHPDFQSLEASWRSLYKLVKSTNHMDSVVIRVLSVKTTELSNDFQRAGEFDQSAFFQKIYSNEFDHPGGEPFGILIGDYSVTHKYTNKNHILNTETLRDISMTAAAAFSPFVAQVDPSLLGLNDFSELRPTINLGRTFLQKEYGRWASFRENQETRFVALLLPKILVREPYNLSNSEKRYGFCFLEDTSKDQLSKFLWGNPCYEFAYNVARSFHESGWLADINGTTPDESRGGKVENLIRLKIGNNHTYTQKKPSTNIIITSNQEKQLNDVGLICLCECRHTDFYSFQCSNSLQRPTHYDNNNANNNSQLSTKLNHVLCVSRFAHYLKVIFRNKIGSFQTVEGCENYLNSWLAQYTADGSSLEVEMLAKYPLKSSKVEIVENKSLPGNYFCKIYLNPQYQFEQLNFTFVLNTKLSGT